MSDDESTVHVTHKVPESLRDDAQASTEHGELSQHVRRVYKIAAYGEADGRRDQLRMELEQIRDEKDRVRGEIRSLQSKLENIERRESRLEERMEQVRENAQKYEGHLESIETSLYSGQNVFAEHGAVQRAAETAGKDPEEVMADLRDRNPSIPGHAFEQNFKTDKRWTGVDPDEK